MAQTTKPAGNSSANTSAKWLFATGLAVLTITIFSFLGSWKGVTVGSARVFALCGILSLGVNWAMYLVSYVKRTEQWFDLTGSLTYLSVVGCALLLGPDLQARSVLLALLVSVWAIRLGSFLFLRIRRAGSDSRFDAIKTDWAKFLMTWTLQALWVLLTAGAALAAMTTAADERLGMIELIGAVLWTLGFGIEVMADRQKQAFRADSANAGRYITTGLWAWSRHPNYFGEILLWVGVAVIAAPALSGWQYATLISPVFVFLLLTRASGIPMLEASAKKRWGKEDAYRAYVAKTPVLFPRPPRS